MLQLPHNLIGIIQRNVYTDSQHSPAGFIFSSLFLLLDKKEPVKFEQQQKHARNSQVGGKPRECDVQVKKKKFIIKEGVYNCVTVNKSIKMAHIGSFGLLL